MEADRAKRRLAAIVAADVAGYSRLVGVDEEGTLARLKALKRDVIEPRLARHSGRVVKTTGDGLLMEFGSAVDAVRCVLDLQRAVAADQESLPEVHRIRFRIGIHVGDVVVDGEDILGDGVNVASRLEQLAEPGGICISARTIEDARGRIDLDLQDIGEPPLKNIDRPVRVYRVAAQTSGSGQPVLALPDKPSIAVLPFQNMSRDPEQDYFADGMVEEIITALTRFHSLFVIARNSSFTYKGKAVDIRQVGRELGVRYVLEGSVRKSGQRVRITGQLIEASTGTHIWSDRFEETLDDVFALQDKVAECVVGVIEPRLRLAEIERTRRKPTESLDAYDHLLRALEQFHSLSRDGIDQALAHLKLALSFDPKFDLAAGFAAHLYPYRDAQGWTDSADEGAREGCRLARLVLDGPKDDALAVAFAAWTLDYFERDHAVSQGWMDYAIGLNTNSFWIWNANGWMRLYAQEPRQALASFERAFRLNPRDPVAGHMMCGRSIAHWHLGELAESLKWARLSVQNSPKFIPSHMQLIVALVSTGLVADARSAASALLRLQPGFSISESILRRPYQNEKRLAALRVAGLPG